MKRRRQKSDGASVVQHTKKEIQNVRGAGLTPLKSKSNRGSKGKYKDPGKIEKTTSKTETPAILVHAASEDKRENKLVRNNSKDSKNSIKKDVVEKMDNLQKLAKKSKKMKPENQIKQINQMGMFYNRE